MKGSIFFFCSCAVLLFSIINLSIGPIVNKKVTNYTVGPTTGNSWGTLNCKLLSDSYKDYKKSHALSDNQKKYEYEWSINECNRKKAMHDMEYTSFIFNLVFGLICGLLGLLHHFELKKEFISKTGLIGLLCGFIGFVFSFIYLVYNGIVYTNYYDYPVPKRDSGGVYAEKTSNTGEFKCLYFDDINNGHSVYATFSDLIQKQYNYEKDKYESVEHPEICITNDYVVRCSESEYINVGTSLASCENLYAPLIDDFANKDLSDRFLTTLILSLFVCLADIVLALVGFLIYRTPDEF